MAGGVGDYLNKKHPQYGSNENDASITQPELSQRQAAAQGMRMKTPGLGAGRRNQSISGTGGPFRDTVTAPARAGSPLAMQQAGAQNGFATQGRHQTNGQGQAYAQTGSLWAESSFGSDSLSTVKDKSFGHYEDGNDHELEDAHGQHVEGHDQDVGLSDQPSDSDPEEEEEVEQNNDGYYQDYNGYPGQLGMNQTSIPMRGVLTNRFGGGSQAQQQQPPIMETSLAKDRRAVNGSGQNYNEKNKSGRLGHQVQEDEDQQQNIDRFAPSEVDEDTIHSIAANGRNHARKGSSKRQLEDISTIDFDHETLFNMSYDELKKQPFDEDPNQVKTPATPSLECLPKSLDERMELFKTKSPEERAEFLATLSIDEWEEAGQWLMSQFGSVMVRVADARCERRKIAVKFENRLAARDAEVRERTDGVTASLTDLKNGGQDLLRGRTPT
ncbi:hypothetical protein VE03_05172 [Pseudogymnoascus sp. 23342-1-I1]|nr:hypothetical protein VE03_05172 [Pseudogymnoascus sp. 23342-1-I1]